MQKKSITDGIAERPNLNSARVYFCQRRVGLKVDIMCVIAMLKDGGFTPTTATFGFASSIRNISDVLLHRSHVSALLPFCC